MKNTDSTRPFTRIIILCIFPLGSYASDAASRVKYSNYISTSRLQDYFDAIDVLWLKVQVYCRDEISYREAF